MYVYIGSYSAKTDAGLHVYRFDEDRGTMTPVAQVSGLKDPSFVHVRSADNLLYTYSRGEQANEAAEAVAFRIDGGTGKLDELSRQATAANAATHLNVTKDGRMLLIVNYGSGTISVLPLGADGAILPLTQQIQHTGSGPNKARQESAHPHSIYPDPADRYAIVPDLGMDKVMVYRIDSNRVSMELHDEAATAPGTGPRHFAFHPQLPFAYLIEELSSQITQFRYDAESGRLQALQSISTLPEGFKGESICSEIQVSPDGRFVYGANRGHDSIAVFEVDQATGALSAVEVVPAVGRHPRNFGLTPSGSHMFIANKDSNSVDVMRIERHTGALTYTGQSLEIEQPTCVRFKP